MYAFYLSCPRATFALQHGGFCNTWMASCKGPTGLTCLPPVPPPWKVRLALWPCLLPLFLAVVLVLMTDKSVLLHALHCSSTYLLVNNQNSFMLHEHNNVLLTKREINMARYWPSFFSACLWNITKSRSIKNPIACSKRSQERMRLESESLSPIIIIWNLFKVRARAANVIFLYCFRDPWGLLGHSLLAFSILPSFSSIWIARSTIWTPGKG